MTIKQQYITAFRLSVQCCKRLHFNCNRIFFIISLILTAQLSFAQDTKVYSLSDVQSKLIIPFENHNNLIILPVEFDGKLKTKFIFDSGARNTVLIERAIADLLQIELSGKNIVHGAGLLEEVVAYRAHGVTVAPEGVICDTTTIFVLERDYLDLPKYLGLEVQGILGYGIFRDFVVEVDYRHSNVILHRPDTYTPPSRYTSFDLNFLNNKPYINVELGLGNGKTKIGNLLVDLGASHALLLELNERTGFDVPEKYLKTSLGRGLSGDINGYIARIESVIMKEFVFHDVVTSYTSGYSKIRKKGRVGTLGGELLSRFNVIFDYSRSKLYLKPNRNFSHPFEYNMSGLELIAFGSGYNRIKVSGVIEGSVADIAGVKEGDEIVKVNRLNLKHFNLNETTALMRSRAGKKIRLKLLRGGEKIKIVFRLKRMI